MTAAPSPTGGLASWAPSVVPPLGHELTPEQGLACAFRVLAAEGFSEHIAGHITMVAEDDQSLLINPWGLWWSEVSASDICRVDLDGTKIGGDWDVTPAISIHTELHRLRPDARVVIHNHPYYVTLLAAVGMLPEVLHQTVTMFEGDLAFVSEYSGEIDGPVLGARLADAIGDASTVILANHGVIITAGTIQEATFRAAVIDRACRLTYDVNLLGRPATAVAPELRMPMKRSILERGSDVYWGGVVRSLIKREPDVLD